MLSLAGDVAYFFEPDHVLPAEYWYKYLHPSESDLLLEGHIRDSFAGRIHDEYVIAEQGLPEMLRVPRALNVLVKWVRFGLSLDWIAARFPELVVIQLVRHPVPLMLSWRQRSWDPAHWLPSLLNQRDLMEGPLACYEGVMRTASSYWEVAAAFWCAVVKMQLSADRPNWLLVEHEWLCADPAHRLRWIVNHVGLEWNSKVEEFISPHRERGSGPGYGARRDPRGEINKWRDRIGREERRQIMAVMSKFELPFYPGLDPTRSWIS